MSTPLKGNNKDLQIRSLVNSAIEQVNQGNHDEAFNLAREFIDQHLDDCMESSDIEILDAISGILDQAKDTDRIELTADRKRQIENLPAIGSLARFSADYSEVDRIVYHEDKIFVVNGQYPIIKNVIYIQGVDHKPMVRNIFSILDPIYLEGLDKFPVHKGKIFFLGRIPENFWHFLFNIVSRLSYLPLSKMSSFEQFLCFGQLNRKQLDILVSMGVPEDKLLILPADYSGHFENLTIHPCGVHSFVCDSMDSGRVMYHDPIAIDRMRTRMSEYFGIDRHIPTEPVFIWRDPAGKRELENQQLIVQRLGLRIFDPIKHTLKEEVEILSRASLVVGSYGAGLTSILFAPKKIGVIQLGISDNEASFYELIATALEQDFVTLHGLPTDEDSLESWKKIDRANYRIDIDKLEPLVHRMLHPD